MLHEWMSNKIKISVFCVTFPCHAEEDFCCRLECDEAQAGKVLPLLLQNSGWFWMFMYTMNTSPLKQTSALNDSIDLKKITY